MRVAELYEPRKFRFLDLAPSDPAPGEVQVRVRSVGICGSDLHYFAEGSIGDVRIDYPVVLGHEPAGDIWKVGPGVTGFSPGDRMLLEPALYCYHCEFCRSGRHNLCEKIVFLSTPPDPGFFRDFVNLPAANVLPLPNGVGYEEGTLFEPLAVVLHSLEFARPRIGETAAVFGAGPIGLLTVAALRAAGVGRIWSIEPRSARRELAKVAGADSVIDPAAVDPVRQILTETGKRGVDMVIDCATKPGTVAQAAACARSAGRLVITGIPSEPESTINLHVLRRKELAVFSVRRSNHESEAALEMLHARADLFAPLITHRLPIEQVGRSFEMLETGDDGAGKIVLNLS